MSLFSPFLLGERLEFGVDSLLYMCQYSYGIVVNSNKVNSVRVEFPNNSILNLFRID